MDYQLYWGDMHCNIRTHQLDKLEEIMDHARQVLDFFPVAYYPFYVYDQQGLRVETCEDRGLFHRQWDRVCQAVAEYNQPGNFITFPGYEWHGDRRYYGDHNLFYFEDHQPLVASKKLEDIYKHLKEHEGLAIPHHTAYQVRERGKDWDYFDPELSPVAEIFSMHGSSEGCQTPYTMNYNQSMGPRVYPGSLQAGLERGHRFGFIASGDNHMGVPGYRDHGVMGLYARELTREAIWKAIKARRTYAVTGDRIKLRFFHEDGTFMGSETTAQPPHQFRVGVEGSDIIDRIDLIRNNSIIDSWVQTNNQDRDFKSDTGSSEENLRRLKLRLQFGWGPEPNFQTRWQDWQGQLSLTEGRIKGVEAGFNWRDQNLEHIDNRTTSWQLTSKAREYEQQLIFTLELPETAVIKIQANGRHVQIPADKAGEFSRVIAYTEQARSIIKDEFDLTPDQIENPDHFYHNAFKMKIHRAVPQSRYRVDRTFTDDFPEPAYYYVRVYQRNGQMAWASPIWID